MFLTRGDELIILIIIILVIVIILFYLFANHELRVIERISEKQYKRLKNVKKNNSIVLDRLQELISEEEKDDQMRSQLNELLSMLTDGDIYLSDAIDDAEVLTNLSLIKIPMLNENQEKKKKIKTTKYVVFFDHGEQPKDKKKKTKKEE